LNEVLDGDPGNESEAMSCYQGQPSACGDGRRIRTVMFYDPAFHPGPGSSVPTKVGNFGDIWLAGFCSPDYEMLPQCQDLDNQAQRNTFVVMYLGPTTSYAANSGGEGGTPSAGVIALRLVE
jgi:hypothetical protein